MQARRGTRAAAAVEFAITLPLLLLFLGGLADFGLALADRGRLAAAVAVGAQYAFRNASIVTAASLQKLVQNSSTLPGVTVQVTGPANYCITGAAPNFQLTNPTSSTCTDGTTPGTYLTISASYNYQPLLPAFSGMIGAALNVHQTERIK